MYMIDIGSGTVLRDERLARNSEARFSSDRIVSSIEHNPES